MGTLETAKGLERVDQLRTEELFVSAFKMDVKMVIKASLRMNGSVTTALAKVTVEGPLLMLTSKWWAYSLEGPKAVCTLFTLTSSAMLHGFVKSRAEPQNWGTTLRRVGSPVQAVSRRPIMMKMASLTDMITASTSPTQASKIMTMTV